MTLLPAKVIAIEKRGGQYQVIVQISTRYRGSFNTLAFGDIKPYSGSLKDGRLATGAFGGIGTGVRGFQSDPLWVYLGGILGIGFVSARLSLFPTLASWSASALRFSAKCLVPSLSTPLVGSALTKYLSTHCAYLESFCWSPGCF
jgi:hypothetical protein